MAQAMKSGADDGLLESWAETLGRGREQPAIWNTRGEVQRTFAEIERRARFYETETALARSETGAVIALQLGNHADWPAVLLACWRRGLVVLPLERTIGEHERQAALQTCNVSAIVELGAVDDVAVRVIDRAARVDWEGKRPALLKLTSGTTAAPRAIRFRSAQLLADGANICATMGLTARDRNFAVIPLSHSYGFSNLITPLLARGVPMILSRDRMPRAVLDDLARTEATVFPGMPVFFQAFGEMDSVPALPALRLCISAGAPLPVAIAQKFEAKFGRRVHSFYGASECGGICYNREGANEDAGFVGQPMEGVEIEMLDPGASASGIRIRSAAVGDGYLPEPDLTRLGNGCFVPDDLLRRDADGFRITGRTSDIINVAGKKVNPAEVEAHLLSFPGVRQAVVFARESALRNQEVAACVLADPGVTESALLVFCRERLSGWQVPKRIFLVPEIPANERGKISRRDLARRFAS